jgi:hypothetical protein
LNIFVFLKNLGIDMLDEIARRLHFNYSIRIATGAAYGKADENGQWTGIIGELSRRVNFFIFFVNNLFVIKI